MFDQLTNNSNNPPNSIKWDTSTGNSSNTSANSSTQGSTTISAEPSRNQTPDVPHRPITPIKAISDEEFKRVLEAANMERFSEPKLKRLKSFLFRTVQATAPAEEEEEEQQQQLQRQQHENQEGEQHQEDDEGSSCSSSSNSNMKSNETSAAVPNQRDSDSGGVITRPEMRFIEAEGQRQWRRGYEQQQQQQQQQQQNTINTAVQEPAFFTCEQLRLVLDLFSISSERKEIVEAFYDHLVDPHNVYDVVLCPCFQFALERDALLKSLLANSNNNNNKIVDR